LTLTTSLTGLIETALTERLLTGDAAPVAVAYSGGGDSLALLLAAKAWADTHGRPLLALTVDHGLRPESAAWSDACRARAAALGVEHRVLPWEGEKPTSRVSAVARAARHRLLAGAARAAGAAVILMGHTADDRAEAALMRREGSTTPSPKSWAPSPVWPEGRGVFLLRPLLDIRRDALRAMLAALGETWIDDPGNTDPRSARARARALIAAGPVASEPDDIRRPSAIDFADITCGAAGDLCIPIDALVDGGDRRGVLGAALLCAAGGERPPRGERLARLIARLSARTPFVATLSGCRVSSDGQRAHLVRDAGDTRSAALGESQLPAGRPVVWDGRFEVAVRSGGAAIGLLAGHAGGLDPALRRALTSLSPAARRALPLVTHVDGRRTLPTVRPDTSVEVFPLAPARLAGTLEAILDEAGLRRMAKSARSY
jgi:tRNA(Ile)-lysidine synthase